MSELFKLKKEQRRAFLRLKRAHADCLNLGIEFYNNYGYVGAVDPKKFERDFYNDKLSPGAIEDAGQNSENEFRLECSEWCDDMHYFHPKPNAPADLPAVADTARRDVGGAQ